MKNIAYKVSKGSEQYPDGFITESIETDEDSLEGYTVVPMESFPKLVQESAQLLHNFNDAKKFAQNKSVSAEKIPQQLTNEAKAEVKKFREGQANEELFKQFLAWKQSQSGN